VLLFSSRILGSNILRELIVTIFCHQYLIQLVVCAIILFNALQMQSFSVKLFLHKCRQDIEVSNCCCDFICNVNYLAFCYCQSERCSCIHLCRYTIGFMYVSSNFYCNTRQTRIQYHLIYLSNMLNSLWWHHLLHVLKKKRKLTRNQKCKLTESVFTSGARIVYFGVQ
jgi:hypothetical protein